MNRKLFLGLERGPLRTKLDNYAFESGANGMTHQLIARGGKVVVAGKSRQYWLPEAWPQSRTFFSGMQENLLIADNRTILYEEGKIGERRRLAGIAWEDESLARPPDLAWRWRRFKSQTPLKLRRTFHHWRQKLSGKATCREVERAMIAAGAGQASDGTSADFGFEARVGGLYLRKDLGEYAEFVSYLADYHKSAQLGIDIGIGSGGQTKFLRDYFPIAETIVIDSGRHHEFHHWQRIRPQVKSRIVLEIIGDSHSQEVYDRLQPYAGKIDFAFFDGDLSFAGMMRDIMLVQELCAPGALFVLHNTKAVAGCLKAFERLSRNPDFELLRTFESKLGIALFRCLRPAPRQPFSRHELAGTAWEAVP